MATEAARVLETWRRAERVMGALPPDAAERAELEVEIDRLRRLYRSMTNDAIPRTDARIAAARDRVERAIEVLDALGARYAVGDSGEPDEPGGLGQPATP